MQKYRLAVCEDDKIIRDQICQVCEELLEDEKIAHEIFPFSDAEKLEQILKAKGEVFDLLLLDIKMENKTGMELAMELRDLNDRVSIIFVTGYEEYLREGYEVQPVHFLLKPLDWEQLKRAVMTDWKINHSPNILFLHKGRRKVRLHFSSILYAETDGNHGVRIVLQEKEIGFPVGLTELEHMLPSGQFVRCHNSYLVNLAHIREMYKMNLRMDAGMELPVSRKYYKQCQNAFVAYMNR